MKFKLPPRLPIADLDRMFFSIGEANWRYLSRKNIFITGGTGFIGKWLLSALLVANKRLELKCKINVLTRSPRNFQKIVPDIARAENLTLHCGDIRNFEFLKQKFHVIVHAATDVVNPRKPLEIFEDCVAGTKRVLEYTKYCGAEDFLLTSSGAIYGKHPKQPTGLDEKHLSAPDPTSILSTYGEGKRASEWLTSVYGSEGFLKVKIARIYAQVGPYLMLDKHFAIGNFIQDVLTNRPIKVRGDGTPQRSYLYAADTAVWLWKMVLCGNPGGVWNVGGTESISIADLAKRVSCVLESSQKILIHKKPNPEEGGECYVPNVSRARKELDLPDPFSLNDAILRTANWCRKYIQLL